MKLSDKDKEVLTDALKRTKNLPPSQGSVTLHITPEGKVAKADISFSR